MNVLDDNRAFAHRRCDTFHRPMAHIAHRENAGDGRFVGERRSLERPLTRAQHVRTGEDVAPFVAFFSGSHSVRGSAPMRMNNPSASWLACSPSRVEQLDEFKLARSTPTHDPAAAVDGDVVPHPHLRDEIVRHARREGPSSDDHRHLSCESREMKCGLSGGVTTSHNEDLFVLHGRGLGDGCAVVDTCSHQRFQRRQFQAAIVCTRSQNNRSGSDLHAVRELDMKAIMRLRDGRCGTCELESDAEGPSLVESPSSELLAGDATREAEVVADPGSRACLASHRSTVQHEAQQAFRSPRYAGR